MTWASRAAPARGTSAAALGGAGCGSPGVRGATAQSQPPRTRSRDNQSNSYQQSISAPPSAHTDAEALPSSDPPPTIDMEASQRILDLLSMSLASEDLLKSPQSVLETSTSSFDYSQSSPATFGAVELSTNDIGRDTGILNTRLRARPPNRSSANASPFADLRELMDHSSSTLFDDQDGSRSMSSLLVSSARSAGSGVEIIRSASPDSFHSLPANLFMPEL